MHLLIPFAAPHADAPPEVLTRLRLPTLERLLARLSRVETDAGDETTLSPPHERAHARALGLPVQDGLIPWAAWQARQLPCAAAALPHDTAWAWISLCHWQAGATDMRLHDPASLQITPAESDALCNAMRAYFAEDGITLIPHAPGRWLAHGEAFRDLPSASLDRVIGRRIASWMPSTSSSRPLRRLQNEMQMLLHAHPVNEARAEQGRPPINSFWISGSGALPIEVTPSHSTRLHMPMDLRDAALRDDWAQWQAAWHALDAGPVAQALTHLERDRSVTLTLCGERHARQFAAQRTGLLRHLSRYFSKSHVSDVLCQL